MIRSAGIVVARRQDGRWRVLLLRAFRAWDFPKGELHPGEDPLAAALRETREETGIVRLSFPWGTEFVETQPYRRGTKIARYYLAETDTAQVELPVQPALGKPEHHEFRWVELDELAALAPPRLEPVVRWVREKLAP
ncbi:MAG: NUDIX domain-containing protein [Desulfobacterales bacterium]